MNDRLLHIYHRLPPAARNLVASLHGHRLRSRRYGPETDRLVAQAIERECWSSDDWEAWQNERLAFVLRRAATQVPYYREQWTRRRRNGDRASWEYLENWPLLDKEPIRANPTSFVADDCDTRRMFHVGTSGTTGKPLDIWLSRGTLRQWYALFEARGREWYGVSRHDRWANLGGQLVTPVNKDRPPFWVWNAALHQLYMSSHHLSPALIPHYLDALSRFRVAYLWGYTSSLYALAQEALRLGRHLSMSVAITNAEPVFEYQRQAIADAFRCDVRETYGMAEIAAAAGECEAGNLHTWPEAGVLEVAEDDGPVSSGESGELVCTGLMNADMPLIRYRAGDRGALTKNDISCSCGRTLPLLGSIEGRTDDVLYTSDGRQIGRLDHVFKANLPVREAQIVQETLDTLRVRYVPAADYSADAGRSMVERLRDRMGAVDVILEQVNDVPRTANGKFQAVVCNLPSEERPAPSGSNNR